MVIKEVEKQPLAITKVAWALSIVSLGTLAGAIMLVMSLVFISWGLALLGFSAFLGLVAIGLSAIALSNGSLPRQVIGSVIAGSPSVIAGAIAIILFFS